MLAVFADQTQHIHRIWDIISWNNLSCNQQDHISTAEEISNNCLGDTAAILIPYGVCCLSPIIFRWHTRHGLINEIFNNTLKSLSARDFNEDVILSDLNNFSCTQLAVALEQNTSITSLNLKNLNYRLMKAAINMLKINPNLKELTLHSNYLTNKLIIEIANSLNTIGLTELALHQPYHVVGHNRFNDLEALAIALGANNSLKKLSITGDFFRESITKDYINSVFRFQMSMKGFEEALQKNTTLETLEIYQNFTDYPETPCDCFGSCFCDIVDAIPESVSVNATENLFKCLNSISETHSIKSLTLQGFKSNFEFSKQICKIFSKNSSITYLNLDKCEIDSSFTQEIAVALKTNKTLKRLSLAYNSINDASPLVDLLNVNTTLLQIDINDNAKLISTRDVSARELLDKGRKDIVKSGNRYTEKIYASISEDTLKTILELLEQNRLINQ